METHGCLHGDVQPEHITAVPLPSGWWFG
jgi:hypothetical protein